MSSLLSVSTIISILPVLSLRLNRANSITSSEPVSGFFSKTSYVRYPQMSYPVLSPYISVYFSETLSVTSIEKEKISGVPRKTDVSIASGNAIGVTCVSKQGSAQVKSNSLESA